MVKGFRREFAHYIDLDFLLTKADGLFNLVDIVFVQKGLIGFLEQYEHGFQGFEHALVNHQLRKHSRGRIVSRKGNRYRNRLFIRPKLHLNRCVLLCFDYLKALV